MRQKPSHIASALKTGRYTVKPNTDQSCKTNGYRTYKVTTDKWPMYTILLFNYVASIRCKEASAVLQKPEKKICFYNTRPYIEAKFRNLRSRGKVGLTSHGLHVLPLYRCWLGTSTCILNYVRIMYHKRCVDLRL